MTALNPHGQVGKSEKAGLQRKLAKLISDRAELSDDPDLDNLYRDQIKAALDALRLNRERLRDQPAPPSIQADARLRTARQIIAQSLLAFWQQDETTLNVALHALLGQFRLQVIDKHIGGLVLYPRAPHRKHRA